MTASGLRSCVSAVLLLYFLMKYGASAPPAVQLAPPENVPPHPFSLYRVCSAAATGELFRFDLEHQCPDTTDKNHTEGILLIFKKNIVPVIFDVRRYRKIITLTTVYKGLFETAVTHKTDHSLSIPLYETSRIDTTYECFSSATANVSGYVSTYTDRDWKNESVPLKPVEGLTTNIHRYTTQPNLYADPSWFPGVYRTRTTVSCEVVDMYARSSEPFNFFVTAFGDTVEMSPFFNESSPQPDKGFPKVDVLQNYTMVRYDKRSTVKTVADRVFADANTFTVSFQKQERNKVYCPLVLWKSFSSAIQTDQGESFHFVANAITATFTTPKEQVKNFNSTHACLMDSVRDLINSSLDKVSSTHIQKGPMEVYETEGHLWLVWVPLQPISLEEARKRAEGAATTPAPPMPTAAARLGRAKRSLRESSPPNSTALPDTIDNVSTPQLQFAYDRLRESINQVLEELSRTWCREQVRNNYMWYELSKISPSSVMTAIYEKPVSARRVGDAILVTDCVNVDQSSVHVHTSMRTEDPNVCYSRPQVTFKFQNGTTLFNGQLGYRNEILLTISQIEECQANAEHYFLSHDGILYYKDYVYEATLNFSSISTLDTFITLNLTFITNIDFRVIELYSQSERKLASVFDLETMFRQYNYYTQRLTGLKRDLDNSIHYNRDSLIQTFSDILEDLGNIGKVIVNTVSVIVSFVGGLMTGIINFLKNPFGGLLLVLIVVGVIILVLILTRRSNQMYQAPIKVMYPDLDAMAKRDKVQPASESQVKALLLGMHKLHQEEYNKKHPKQTNSVFDKWNSNLRRRQEGGTKVKYSALNNNLEMDEP